MNPNSNYYLAINTGFPNAYDRANGRNGALLMIHGDCSSRGCYAMTDEQIGEIYSLGRESFLGGQHSFQIQAYPFRMTPLNMARHRTNPNMAFWKMLKEGNDHFEVTHLEPKVDVCNRHYVFDAQQPADAKKSLVFNPTGPCPAYTLAPEVAEPLAGERAEGRRPVRPVCQKQHPDRADQNRPRRRHEPGLPGAGRRQHPAGQKTCAIADAAAARCRPTMAAVNRRQRPARRPVRISGRGRAGASRRYRYAEPWSAAKQTAAAASSTACSRRRVRSRSRQPPPVTTATVEPPKPKSVPRYETAAVAPKPKAEPRKTEPQQSTTATATPATTATTTTAAAAPKPKPASQQQEANAAAPPAATGEPHERRSSRGAVGQLRQPLGRVAVIRHQTLAAIAAEF